MTIYPTTNDVGGGGQGSVHTESNLSDRLKTLGRNHVVSGLGLAANGADVDAAAGVAWVEGYVVTTDAVLSITPPNGVTRHVYLLLTRSGGLVTGATLALYTSDQADLADAVRLGTVTTAGGVVTDTVDDPTTDPRPDVALLDASRPFTSIPVLPGTDPVQANHATRKSYVDARIAASLAAGAYKTADESVVNSTVLQDDDELQFEADANATYIVRAIIHALTDSGGLRVGLAAPAGATVTAILIDNDGIKHVNDDLTDGTGFGPVGAITSGVYGVVVEAVVKTGANGGTVAFQWAQNVTNANASTVKTGSMLAYEKR